VIGGKVDELILGRGGIAYPLVLTFSSNWDSQIFGLTTDDAIL
jgi:hypothetical protein